MLLLAVANTFEEKPRYTDEIDTRDKQPLLFRTTNLLGRQMIKKMPGNEFAEDIECQIPQQEFSIWVFSPSCAKSTIMRVLFHTVESRPTPRSPYTHHSIDLRHHLVARSRVPAPKP